MSSEPIEMRVLKRSLRVFGKNFFRLTLPFLLLLGVTIGRGSLAVFQSLTAGIVSLLGEAFLGLFCISGLILDTWGALNNRQFGFRESWGYVARNLPRLLLSVLIAAAPWLMILYLFFHFFNFFLFLPLAVYPFFFVFTLPELLINDSGPFEAFQASFQLSLTHSTRTILLTYLPGTLATYLYFLGFQSLVVLLVIPAWFVTISTQYCILTESAGPVEYFKEVPAD